jgi:hypothetical protein
VKGESKCKTCGINFCWRRSSKQVIPECCSIKCRGHTGFRPGSPLFISEMTDEQKLERLKKSFEKHVVRTEGCWGWKGSLTKQGYPVMSCRKEIGSDRGHRASWIIHKGVIPPGMYICHSCDNPICTNPDHLWVGTYQQNQDDKMKKGRHRWEPPPIKKGEENASSKLKTEDVIKIKTMIKEGYSLAFIGKQFNVHRKTIGRIKNGTHWNHVILEE